MGNVTSPTSPMRPREGGAGSLSITAKGSSNNATAYTKRTFRTAALSQEQSNWMAAKVLIKLSPEWSTKIASDKREHRCERPASTSQSSPLKVSLNRCAYFGWRFI